MCNVYLIHSHKRIRHAQNNLFLFLYSFFFFVCSNITIAMNVLNGTFQQSWKQMILHSFGCFFFVCFFNLAQILLKSIQRFWFFFSTIFFHPFYFSMSTDFCSRKENKPNCFWKAIFVWALKSCRVNSIFIQNEHFRANFSLITYFWWF